VEEPIWQNKLEQLAEQAQHTFWGHLGCKLVEIKEDKVVATLDVQQQHLNLLGILHGGVHAALLDSAMGLVAMSARQSEQLVTSTMHIHFTAPAGPGEVSVVAEVLHSAGKTVTTQGKLTNHKGELCALATAAYRIVSDRSERSEG